MKKFLLQLLVTFLVFSGAIAARAQSNYEPYWFATLDGLAGTWGLTDGIGRVARFEAPAGVAVDSAGNIYVADRQNYAIRKITPAGAVTTVASGDTLLEYPEGIAVDNAGNIYTTHGCAIRKIAPNGVMTILAGERASCYTNDGTGSNARFDFPAYVATDSSGNVYVTERDGCVLRKITPAGVATTLAGLAGITGSADGTGSVARFQYPGGVAVDSAGYIYVADWGNSTIRKVTPTGDVSTLAGLAHSYGSNDGIGSAARFYGATGVAVDAGGNVYATDSGNGTIRKITPAGVVTTLAGLPRNFGSIDATGSVARFQSPSGIAVDGPGRLYVADNQTIRVGGVPVTLTDVKSVLRSRGFAELPVHFALAGEPTVECRANTTAGEHALVFTFTRDIMNATATITGGVGSLSGNPTFSANQMSVNLTGVANTQLLTIGLSNIVDIQGHSLPDTNVTIAFLFGDTNGDTVVNASDVSQTHSRVGQVVTDSNFRSDVNADRVLTRLDEAFVRLQIGNGIPVPGAATRPAVFETNENQ